MSWRTLESSSIRHWIQRAYVPSVLVFAWLCWGLSARANDELVRDSTPASWQDDAELTDVFFLNANNGWAVGAQGTILRTTNGGQDWQELGRAVAVQTAPEMGFQQKIRAMQQGQRTQLTGVADGSSDQAQPYRCRFESVFFVDEQNGWVAGGYEVPYLNHSRGILLRTADGGVTWRQVRGALLPAIKRIRFSDRTHGWAAGDRGNLLPGSLFYTTDGGETWSNQSVQRELTGPFDCRDADATEHGFIALDDEGQPIVIKNGQVEPAIFEGGRVGRLNRLKMIDRQEGWCAGDTGALWRTLNGGVSWRPLVEDTDSPMFQQLREFDWQALASSPSKIWFAGNPGSQLFSIDRETGAMHRYSTGLSTPIQGLHFVDDQHGWLVGSLGTILATSDGGQTWNRQRGRQRGVAVLGLAFDQAELPLEALAMYSSEENWLMAVAICGEQTPAAQQSVERLGGVGLFSLAAGGPAASFKGEQEEQLERLVKLIRTIRPTVILCNSEYRKQAGSDATPTAAFDPSLLISTAVQAASDRNAYPHQLEFAKLEPWSVERIAYRAPAGELSLEPKRMLLQLGCSIADRIGISRALLDLPLIAGEKSTYYLESGSGQRLSGSSNLFNGLTSGVNGPIPKRTSDIRLRTNRAAIELANRKHEKISEMAQFTANTEQDLIVWNQKIQDWLAPVDESLAGLWLAQLAEEYLERGQTELCAKSLEYLIQRYHGHALRLASLTWLVNYFSSDEFGRLELANLSKFRKSINQSGTPGGWQGALVGRPTTQAHTSHQDGQTILVWAPVSDKIELPRRERPAGLSESSIFSATETATETPTSDPTAAGLLEPHPAVETASHSEVLTGFSAEEVQTFLQSRWRRASHFMSQLNHVDPDLINQLAFRYLEANLKRKFGGKSAIELVMKRIEAANETTLGLSAAARAELALSDDAELTVLPANTIRALLTPQRPQLDGRLDDAVWQAIRRGQLELKKSVHDGNTKPRGWSDVAPQAKQDVLMFAHDEQFLYVAIECQKVAGQFYQMSPDARPRDPDLRRRDRVELYFDVDRDYQSAFKFTVDYRGWGAEEVNGAVGWNPQWFIARSEDEGSWRVELAIPLETFAEPFHPASMATAEGTQPLEPAAVSTTSAALPVASSASPSAGRSKPMAAIKNSIWSLRLARVATAGNLWENSKTELEKSELSKGLYQQILLEPAKFSFFAFQ